MNGSFDAKICHTDVKFHGVVQNNVKRNLSTIMIIVPPGNRDSTDAANFAILAKPANF